MVCVVIAAATAAVAAITLPVIISSNFQCDIFVLGCHSLLDRCVYRIVSARYIGEREPHTTGREGGREGGREEGREITCKISEGNL